MSHHRPIPVVFVNLIGAMDCTNRGPFGNRMLTVVRKRITALGGGLIVAVEADDVDVRGVLGDDWWVKHRQGHDQDGVLVAGTKDRSKPISATWLPGAPSSPENAPRPILRVRVRVDPDTAQSWTVKAGAMHYPKPHGGQRAAEVMVGHAHSAGLDVFGTDGNAGLPVMRHRFPGAHIDGAEVVWFVANPHTVTLSPVTHFDVIPGETDDDHPALVTHLAPR